MTMPDEMSREELLALPVTIDLVTAARALGMGRTKAYELVRRGEFPVPVVKLGNRQRVVTEQLLAVLGVDQAAPRQERPASTAPVEFLPEAVALPLLRALTWCGHHITEAERNRAWAWVESHREYVEEMGG